MPVIGGPVSAIFIAAVLLVGAGAVAGARATLSGSPAAREDDIDREELEAAEREVRELERGALPDDERPGDDWGPGTGRPRPPTRL